jgi:hypothetical protein
MTIHPGGVHAQTSILPAPHNLAPIADQVCAHLQRPERGAKRRRRRLQELRGEVVHDRLLYADCITSSQKTEKKSQLEGGLEIGRGEEGERENGQP